MSDNKTRLFAATRQLWLYFLFGTSSFGCYHLAHIFGWTNLQVDAITISPAQAAQVQNNLEFDTETIVPKKSQRGSK